MTIYPIRLHCQYPFINNKFLKRSYDIFVDKEITEVLVIYNLFMSYCHTKRFSV
jgi:hypothetical protein